MTISKAVLLVGSAKPDGTSTSEALGRYLTAPLEAAGVPVHIVDVVATRTAAGAAHLAANVSDADLFILASPLYVDSLPYLVTRALESLAASRSGRAVERPCAFAAVVNCGFPEAAQCRTALEIARSFARRARFQWAGGLALGEGGVIDGRLLDETGRATRHVRAALDATAEALLNGLPIPDEAVKGMARPLVPAAVYTFFGDLAWKRKARRNGVRRQLAARPFDV